MTAGGQLDHKGEKPVRVLFFSAPQGGAQRCRPDTGLEVFLELLRGADK